MLQAYIGFQQINPNKYGNHRQIKYHETVPSTLLFKCNPPKRFLIHSNIENEKLKKDANTCSYQDITPAMH